MSNTPRLGFPLIDAGQRAQYLTHNDDLMLLDVLVQARFKGFLDAPPESPVPENGDVWIVRDAGSDSEWVGHEDEIAFLKNNAWAFIPPQHGFLFWSEF